MNIYLYTELDEPFNCETNRKEFPLNKTAMMRSRINVDYNPIIKSKIYSNMNIALNT